MSDTMHKCTRASMDAPDGSFTKPRFQSVRNYHSAFQDGGLWFIDRSYPEMYFSGRRESAELISSHSDLINKKRELISDGSLYGHRGGKP